MTPALRTALAAAAILGATLLPPPVAAEQRGGTLRVDHREDPARASVHAEASIATIMAFMAVFNNLVVYNLNCVS